MSTAVTITEEQAGQTVAALLRQLLSGQSWSQVRQVVAARRVRINGEVWLDSARRLKAGDSVEVTDRSAPRPRQLDDIVIRHRDEHIVVVEKQSGISTVRHPSEREWSEERRRLVPVLQELVFQQIVPKDKRSPKTRLRIVHRLDKETSGLVVFARTADAERGLGKQFHAHTVTRRYVAVVHGDLAAQRIESTLVRDRGDGRRGSTLNVALGKRAVTHVQVLERLAGYSVVSCQLETGRTHQIRIHLSELGNLVCGEKVYNRAFGQPASADNSGAPRLALHAIELGFQHPVTGASLHWEMPLPADLQVFIERLRNAGGPPSQSSLQSSS